MTLVTMTLLSLLVLLGIAFSYVLTKYLNLEENYHALDAKWWDQNHDIVKVTTAYRELQTAEQRMHDLGTFDRAVIRRLRDRVITESLNMTHNYFNREIV